MQVLSHIQDEERKLKVSEKARNTIHIKGKEVSRARGYKDHCRLLICPDKEKIKSLTNILISLFVYTGGINSLPTKTSQITIQTAKDKKRNG